MKKKLVISFICLLAINNLNAESIFEEEKNTSNTNKKEKANIQRENLDYLFKNSDTKFPITDYIYKGGFKEPNENNSLIKEEKKDENQSNDILKDIELEKQRLINENRKLARELQQENIKKEEDNLKKLIRDSILAERANTQIYIQDTTSRYGADGFSNQKSVDISTNEHKLYRTIRAGRLIPAILTSAISSDLSGIVTAQIEQDIYATMGRAVLIPRGSKAIGFYKNDNKIGQDRLEIAWREIITPQGVNIMLTGAIASDNMGMSGALGSVNNKYLERYGMPYALSTASNVLLLSIASKIKGNNTYAQEIYSQSKNDVSTIVDDILQQQSQIKPTIEIKSGSRIFIVPTNHMWFAKPKNGEVLIKYFQED
ncbi:TrbI/VirB10 family protein [Campylobacter lari]|nr:TrbI/VirB10 family protein [Campylobacter lari]